MTATAAGIASVGVYRFYFESAENTVGYTVAIRQEINSTSSP